MDYLVDTSFLIGLWRQPEAGPERRFLESHADSVIGLPWVVCAEFLSGAVVAAHGLDEVKAFLSHYPAVWPDESIVMRYAQTFAELRQSGKHVGTNDLWIAAAAVERGLPLLTQNVKEFTRVDGLEIIEYSRLASEDSG